MPPKSRELKLPSQLLDQIGGENFNDKEWQESHNYSKKRKSRKESRKELRNSKKLKNNNDGKRGPGNKFELSKRNLKPDVSSKERRYHDETAATQKSKKPEKSKGSEKSGNLKQKKSDKYLSPFVSAHDEELRRKDEEDAKYYAKKLGLKSLKLKDENDGLDDILGELDFDNFSEGDNEDPKELSDPSSDQSENDSDEEMSDDLTPGETITKPAALKKGKNSSKEDELNDTGSDDFDLDDFSEENDDDEMTAEETMAKLAALKGKVTKNTKVKNAKADGDFDGFDSDDDDGFGKTTVDSSTLGEDDDSLSEGDFEDDDESDDGDDSSMTAEETMAKLKALKQKKASQSNDHSNNKFSDGGFGDESDDSDDEDDDNPYVPPKRHNTSGSASDKAGTKNLPDSEAIQAIKRVFKGALNKLTESTLPHVTNEIELAFVKNSRAEASEVLTDQLLEMVDGPQPLQHTLYTVYAGLISALYQSIGVGFAAHFIQTVVERVTNNINQASNLLNLLMECYILRVISSRLPYELMKHLLGSIASADSLAPVELLLVIIRNGGSNLRSDDPVALKEVIILLQQRVQQLGGAGQLTPRMRFLVDAIVALKNNRQKPISETVVSLRHRIRKTIQNKSNSKSSEASKEPLQVGLSDILDSATRGKWWLVGASWKGNYQNGSGADFNEDKLEIDIDDEFGASTPDWLELAKKQRLNTDVRRAIFVALMGAEDYLDACLRIDKLGLKNKQERDVPHVILHCLCQEPYYNPYYALVAGKQCGRHSTMKTFQFRLWDWLNSDPHGSPQIAMHYGRFFAALVSQRVMPLEVLKMADFLGGSSDIQVFLQFFLVTLYKDLAKQAEKIAKQTPHRGFVQVPGSGNVERDGKDLVLLLSKVRDATVLRGLQITNKTILKSEAITSEKDRKRVEWVAQFSTDIIDEIVKKTE